jgi:hypothetical protein
MKDSPVTEFNDLSSSDVENTEDYFGEASETDEANTPACQRIPNLERVLSGGEDGRPEFENPRDNAGSPNVGQPARSPTDPPPGVTDSANMLVSVALFRESVILTTSVGGSSRTCVRRW